MRSGVGAAVAAAILVLLPLGAVWLAGRWRDPPRERWAVTAPPGADAIDALGLAEFRIRRQYGIRDEARWSAVRQAVSRGEAGPDSLRPVTREWARAVLASYDAELSGSRWAPARVRSTVHLALGLTMLAVAGTAAFFDPGLAIMYAIYSLVLLLTRSPVLVRRRRARAEAALVANQ